MISILAPLYNEGGSVAELHRRIVKVVSGLGDEYEIIFVNDGSTDNTETVTRQLRPLRLVSLQRNYGQTPAIDTGIFWSRGDILVLLDADLQNDPADIPKLLAKLNEGFDVVIGRRARRADHWTRLLFSRLANFIARHLLGLDIHDFGCGLKAYRSKFVKDFRLWGEAQVFLPAIAKQRGAKITEVEVNHHARQQGAAKVKISKMVRGVFDLLAIVFFVHYAAKPLRFFGGWGLVSIILAAASFVSALALRFLGFQNLTETPLPVVGTLFTILGVMLFMLGLIAEMLLRMQYSVTNSSPYFVREIRENK